jgi:hypothetical protein
LGLEPRPPAWDIGTGGGAVFHGRNVPALPQRVKGEFETGKERGVLSAELLASRANET